MHKQADKPEKPEKTQWYQCHFCGHMGEIVGKKIMGKKTCAEEKLSILRSVKGNISIFQGIAILPDGTQITL